MQELCKELKYTKKLGIMGGSFDPPHVGHFIMAETALDALGLDKVLFVPTGKIVYKPEGDDRADGIHRYKMIERVIRRNPGFCLTDMEIRHDETTYTANTLRRISEALPGTKLYFIVGADSLDYMEKWYMPERIFRLCTVAAMMRRTIPADRFMDKIRYLTERYGADIIRVNMPLTDVSSTEIRKRIRRGDSVRYLCDDEIIDYIKENGLYTD